MTKFNTPKASYRFLGQGCNSCHKRRKTLSEFVGKYKVHPNVV